MAKFSSTYRLAALALVLSLALGAALPAFCPHEAMAEHAGAAGHPAAPCEGICHAAEQPATMPLAAVVPAPDRSPKGPTVLPAPSAAPPRGVSAGAALGERGHPLVARAGPPPSRPVRLHVQNAVFLN